MFHEIHEYPEMGPVPESPRHGYQGDRALPPEPLRIPASLTIALSREAGARGRAIAQRVGEELGWMIYTQELLEYSVQDELARQQILGNLSPDIAAWVEEQMKHCPALAKHTRHPLAADLVRLVLALGAVGEVIIIGRGAGYILPRQTTLHVRLVAPLEDRIAYMSQWMRLTREEATRQVELRDERREEFIQSHFGTSPKDVHQYDLVLNTSFMGEEMSAALIREAAKTKLAGLYGPER